MADKEGYINILALESVRKTSFNSERVRGLNDVLKVICLFAIVYGLPMTALPWLAVQ